MGYNAQITGKKEAFWIDLVFVFSQLGLMERQLMMRNNSKRRVEIIDIFLGSIGFFLIFIFYPCTPVPNRNK